MDTAGMIFIIVVIGIVVVVMVPFIIMATGSFIMILALPFTAPFLFPKFTYSFLYDVVGINKGVSIVFAFLVFLLTVFVVGSVIWVIYRWVI